MLPLLASTAGVGGRPCCVLLRLGIVLAPRYFSIHHRRRTSAYFRGPENHLNLPAGNLAEFIQLAQEIDDATWQYHLQRGDYTHWFQIIWQDEELAATAAELEHAELSAHESRVRMQELIAQRYALPT
jgi:hypothetical protein